MFEPSTFVGRIRTQLRTKTEPSHDEEMRGRVARTVARGRAAIDLRLGELDGEWDDDRSTYAVAGCVALGGVLLSATSGRGWLIVPAVAALFVVGHAVTGGSPASALAGALGVRSRRAIEIERGALKAARGDYRALGGAGEYRISPAASAALVRAAAL